MHSLGNYMIRHCVPYPLIDVEAIYMEPSSTLEQFRTFLRHFANSSEIRLLANFHRTPLFYSERSTKEEAYHRAYAGHWSPVGGFVEQDGKEYVLVLDTNDKWGPYMVEVGRFFLAVKTLTINDGCRGFLKVRINHNHSMESPARVITSAEC